MHEQRRAQVRSIFIKREEWLRKFVRENAEDRVSPTMAKLETVIILLALLIWIVIVAHRHGLLLTTL